MTKRSLIIARAVGVVGVTAATMTGATFAALQSSVVLADNTISTASASLLISKNGVDFAQALAGFDFEGVVPGDEGTEKRFFLKNEGGVPLAISLSIPAGQGVPSGVRAEDVKIVVTDEATGEEVATSLAALRAGDVVVDELLPTGAEGNAEEDVDGNYTIAVVIDEDAVKGSSASVGEFDLIFTGTQTEVPAATPAPEEVPEAPEAPATGAEEEEELQT